MSASNGNRLQSSTRLWQILLIAVAFWALYPNILRPGVWWGDDWAMYLAHARNIVTGHPYLDTGFLYTRLTAVSSPSSCPPGYPFLLSLIYRFKGFDLEALKLVNCVAAALALFFCGWYLRTRLSHPWTVVLLAALGASRPFLDEISGLQPHMVCVVLVFVCFLVCRLVREKCWDRDWPALAALLVLIPVLLATFTRIASLPMVGAVVLEDLWRRHRLTSFAAMFGGGFVVLFWFASRAFPGGASYADQLHIDPMIYVQHAWEYVKASSYVWINSFSSLLRFATFGVLTATAGVAFCRRVRQGPGLAEFFCALHMAMLVAYPSGFGLAYMLPVIPLYFAYAVEGALWLTGRFGRRAAPALSAALAAMLLAIPAGNLLRVDRSPFTDGPGRPQFQELLREVAQRTGEGDRFLLWKPRAFSFLSGRRAGFYVRTEDSQVFLRDIADRKIGYVVRHKDDPEDDHWLAPKLIAHADRFDLGYENAEFALYAVRR